MIKVMNKKWRNNERQKRIIVFPTDTIYGIGCNIFDKESIEKIYQIKHRDRKKPLACLCKDVKQVGEIAFISEIEKTIISKLNITLILKAKSNIAEITGFNTIGVRIPQSKYTANILNKYGPMLTTSVNESGEKPLNTYDEICNKYEKWVDKVYKGKKSSSGVASTVAQLVNGEVIIIRKGEVKKEQIESLIYTDKVSLSEIEKNSDRNQATKLLKL